MDWKKIDIRLSLVNRRLGILSNLRPINLKEERRMFFSNNEYNPKFEYRKIKFKYDDGIKELDDMQFDNSPLGQIFNNKRNELLKKIDLIKSIGTSNITLKSNILYGQLDNKIIAKAKKELRGYKKIKDGRKLGFNEVKNIIESTFRKYKLKNWHIKRKSLVADCAWGKNRIFLRPDVRFSKERLKKTIAHEIETHVLRKENGSIQPYQILSYGTAGHEFTEEGLAIFNERLVSSKKDEKRYWPSAYVIAVNEAQKSSFREVYNTMRLYNFSKIRSWVIATKVKRGLGDTSQPGGYTKDYIYFAGRYLVEEYLRKGGSVKDLYLGKIGIDDVEIAKSIDGIKCPKYLPKFYKL